MKHLITLSTVLITITTILFYDSNSKSEQNKDAVELTETVQKPHEVSTERDTDGDTFSIVAYDPATGEIGGAGTSCVGFQIDFLNEIIIANNGDILGAIHTQAAAAAQNATIAKNRMLAGDTPQQIINYVTANDYQGNPSTRQYGIVGFNSSGNLQTAAYTGSSNGVYGNHITGPNYSIQGNILDEQLGQKILENMETAFLENQGTLAEKLMAALQGAKQVGADKRCGPDGNGAYNTANQYNSGRASFIRVRKPSDNGSSANEGTNNFIDISIDAVGQYVEPIDVLQCTFDSEMASRGISLTPQVVTTFPYTMDFESTIWKEESSCGVPNAWIRSEFASPSGNTGPSGASQGDMFVYFEATDLSGNNTGLGTTGYIASPNFTIPEDFVAQITFDYHMYENINTVMGTLSLEANDGSGWTQVWSKTGSQGNAWQTDETLNLIGYDNTTVKLRFKAAASNSYANDFGLDNIRINLIALCDLANDFDGTFEDSETAGRLVRITSNYSTGANGNLDACNLVVTNNATLTIDEDTYVNIQGNITVESGSSLIVKPTGSLVQVNEDAQVINNGTINVEVETLELKPRDFVFLGSPMTADTKATAFPGADRVMYHETANFVPHPDVTEQLPMAENFADDNFNNFIPHTGAITPAQGFLVRPRPINATGNEVYEVTFNEGTLNTGEITYDVEYNTSRSDSYNVLANPYASAIDAIAFIEDNAEIDAIYLWEHIQSPDASFPGANTVNFSMEDVTMFNLLGGNQANGAVLPNDGNLATGQGFGVKALSAGTVSFTNSMRLTGNNNTLRTTAQQTDKIWISILNEEYNLGGSTLIGFTENATAGIDTGYDANRLATAVSIFSQTDNGDEELGIQGREIFNEVMTIPLGFSTQIDDEVGYTISIKNIEGANILNATVYLVDHLLNQTINLTEGDHNFTASKGSFAGRFTLQFEDRAVLNNSNYELNQLTVSPNPATSLVNITAGAGMMKTIALYDLNGRLISNSMVNSDTHHQMNIEDLPSGLYLLSVQTENGILNKKLIKR